MSTTPTYRGHCLCGGVRFRIAGPLAPIQVCHCSQCRRAQGTAIATNVPVADAAYTLEAGAALLKAFEATPGKRRWFCQTCGSPVYSERDSLPGVKRIRIGLITDDLDVPIEAQYFWGSRASWWTGLAPAMDEGVPCFEAGPDSAQLIPPGRIHPA